MNDQLIFQLNFRLSPFNINVFGIKPTQHVIQLHKTQAFFYYSGNVFKRCIIYVINLLSSRAPKSS